MDAELKQMIKDLTWDIDLNKDTCKSKIVHYRIINSKKKIEIESEWITPDIPNIKKIEKDIRKLAIDAITESMRWIKIK